MTRIVIENAHIATVDPDDTEIAGGHVVVAGNRIEAVGSGPAPAVPDVVRRVDASGHLVTPGLVNTHHHFYQWITRGLAQNSALFDWLVELYPTWAHIDDVLCHAAAQGSAAALMLSGCTTATDHAYVFPRGGGDILGAEIAAVAALGLRFQPTRGSMDLSVDDGGLPPANVTEDTDEALAATEAAIDRWHDPSFGSMLRITAAPCSPFSVSAELLRGAAELARRKGVRLHTHGSETVEEEQFCREKFGMGPTDYFASLGWLGDDVWMAHSIHMSDADIAAFAATRTGVATCPSSNARIAAGTARVPALLAAGVPVGLGVDGAASNESGELLTELRNLALLNRVAWGPDAMPVRRALRVATMGGAQVLGRDNEIGSLEPGKLADLAVWKLDGFRHAGIADKVAALALGAAAPLTLLLVDGIPVVEHGHLTRVDEDAIARNAADAAATLARRAGLH
ncbi:8-oxoguanine deaminase [Yinghuangia aomiensis]